MMATPHLLTGAVAGKVLASRPWLALPAALVSHFVFDVVPHVDSHTFFGVAQGGPTAPEAGIAVADFILGCAIVLVLTRSRSWRAMALWGALCGIVIDLADNLPPWGDWFSTWPGTAWLSGFHHGIQLGLGTDALLLGFGPQIAVVCLMAWLLRRSARQSVG